MSTAAHRRRLQAAQTLVERGATPGERQAAEAVARLKAAAPPPPKPTPDLVGLKVQLERQVDRLRACCRRGCLAVIERDDARQVYDLRCAACGRHLGVLPTRVSDQLSRWLSQGRLSAAVLQDAVVKLAPGA